MTTLNPPTTPNRKRRKPLRRLRWFTPGLGVKRWLLFILGGTTLIGVGLALVILDIYRSAPDTWWLPLLSMASLRSLDRWLRALIFGALGTLALLGGIYGLNRALLAPFRQPHRGMLDELSEHRRRERGPRIVAIGGGHGLSAVLRGLKNFSSNITAVVTVADDGGSSGRLRQSLGVLPPGDIRNCLAALSNDEALLSKLFQYRFPGGDADEPCAEGGGLAGHSFGNLFIAALADLMGSFEQAVAESSKVLGVHGRVLPATLHDVRLVADMAPQEGSGREVRVRGESQIPAFPGQVRRVWLEPDSPPAYPQVLQALLGADIIVVGPGSLYTSLLPNLLVPDISAALQASRSLKIFVSNLTTQPGETDGYSVEDHIEAIKAHIGLNPFDIILANNRCDLPLPEGMSWSTARRGDLPLYETDLVDEERPGGHSAEKLAKIILDLYQEKTGPLVQ